MLSPERGVEKKDITLECRSFLTEGSTSVLSATNTFCPQIPDSKFPIDCELLIELSTSWVLFFLFEFPLKPQVQVSLSPPLRDELSNPWR
jgi:hypothetical protein